MTNKNDLILALKAALEKELALIEIDAKKAHKDNDSQTMRIILSYSKGLQRGCELCSLVLDVIDDKEIK